jgi:nucleotide-binding universal stress UspA family protein
MVGDKQGRCQMVEKMRILIGYDGSDCADAAVYDLRRAGLPRDVEAVVFTAVDLTPHLPPSCYEPADPATEAKEPQIIRNARILARGAMSEARLTADRGIERVRAEFPHWRVSAESTPDYAPYRALVIKAEKWRPDLVVVGSHGRSAAGRALLGSVSTKVLSHAHCSVRVARFREDVGRAAGDPVRLVLGFDGSADSAAAASAVADRVWPQGTEVRVVMALDRRLSMALAFGMPIPVWATGINQGWDDRTRAWHIVEDVEKDLRGAGLVAKAVVGEGDPKQVLIREAEQLGADCIFVGAQGHSALDRFLLGSVSAAVATRAHCSVEVVRPG